MLKCHFGITSIAPVAWQLRLYQRRKIYHTGACERRSGKTSVSHSLKDEGGTSGSLLLSVHKIPDIHGLPEREREQSMLEEVLRFLRGVATSQIGGTSCKLVTVSQDLASDQGQPVDGRIN
jgi:hypothetical protein